MQIYYINLARRTDRRAFMEEQFASLGLAATRIEASTPDTVPAADLANYCDPRRLQWLTPAELACCLSHVEAMRALLVSGEPHATVFEDDAVLSTSLPAFLSALDSSPPNVDLLRIETERKRLRVKPDVTVGGVEIARFVGWEGGSAGYVATRRAAEVILNTPYIKMQFADRALFDSLAPLAKRLVVRQTNPGLCIQSDQLQSPEKPVFAGDLVQAELRRKAEAPFRWRHFWFRRYEAIHRDIVLGLRKAWFQHVGRGRLLRIPFRP